MRAIRMNIAATFGLLTLGLSSLACERSNEPAPSGTSQNLNDVPAMTDKPKESNPGSVPTTDQVQPPTTGPTAGTVPNISPGKNDAPAVDYHTGGEIVPGAISRDETQPVAGNEPVVGSAEQPKRTAEGKIETIKELKLEGEVELSELAKGVRVYTKVSDAPPGRHGIHIHQKADCSDIPGKSMGEHFAPTGHEHGLPGAKERHTGDLGNLTVAQDGTGVLDVVIPDTNLKAGDRMSLLGRALVIHQSEDVGMGKSGQSGSPIACAAIKAD
jgi:superoxide dismutase, Cu-Zn family